MTGTMGGLPPLPPPHLAHNLKLAADLDLPRHRGGHISMKSHHCGHCHAVFKRTCVDAGHMVYCFKHQSYSKWEGHCPQCEREWKAQEQEIRKAKAALIVDREKDEGKPNMMQKKTTKTGKDGKKPASKSRSNWAAAKKGDHR